MRDVIDANQTMRWPASFAVSIAAHAALALLLTSTAVVQLDLVPITIDLSSLDVSDRTAGPGETSRELRMAAPSAPPIESPPPLPAVEEDPPEPVAKQAEPAVQLQPERVAKPKPKPTAKPAVKDAPPLSSSDTKDPAAVGSSAATGASSPEGTETRSTAPAWAPTARVRYEQVLFAWMNRHKQYPMLAQRRGIEGNGSVRVRIDRSGRVLDRAVVETTGEQVLDQAALDMVRRANPFPAVPSEYSGETFEFVAPIQYRMR